jgi:hypothetical protein
MSTRTLCEVAGKDREALNDQKVIELVQRGCSTLVEMKLTNKTQMKKLASSWR